MNPAPNPDELKEPGQLWQMFLETLLWVSAFAGWAAIAYLHHAHPSFP